MSELWIILYECTGLPPDVCKLIQKFDFTARVRDLDDKFAKVADIWNYFRHHPDMHEAVSKIRSREMGQRVYALRTNEEIFINIFMHAVVNYKFERLRWDKIIKNYAEPPEKNQSRACRQMGWYFRGIEAII